VEKMPKLRSMKKQNTVGDDHEEDAQEEEEKHQQTNKLQQPPRKMIKTFRGQKRDYYYLTTVKSLEQLDKFRFKVECKKRGFFLIGQWKIRTISEE
jgi:hypothetical protein